MTPKLGHVDPDTHFFFYSDPLICYNDLISINKGHMTIRLQNLKKHAYFIGPGAALLTVNGATRKMCRKSPHLMVIMFTKFHCNQSTSVSSNACVASFSVPTD